MTGALQKKNSPSSLSHMPCAQFLCWGLQLPLDCAGERNPIVLYFDQKEEFMRTVRRVWERRRKQPGKFRQIRSIEKITSECYPLQLADTLAWIKNRHRPHAQESFVDTVRVSALLMIKGSSLYYELDKILEHYPNGELIQGATN